VARPVARPACPASARGRRPLVRQAVAYARRRAARTAAELDLGPLRSLDEVIPELAAREAPRGGGGGNAGPGRPILPPPAYVGGAALPEWTQERTHADLNVAERGGEPLENTANPSASHPGAASLNPLIVVRIHAPEPAAR
jgi:hypothetical protein